MLVVDADEMIRATLKGYLGSEGYEVMAVSNCPDAREVLNMFTPALVIAEVEGDGLPGYDLCAHVKQSPRLKHIPVVLTTSSGYPSDYSNAHSLGAVVCMTKPYKQERLGHVVRLLVPPPRGILRAEEWRGRAASGRSEPPLRLRQRRRERQQRSEWEWSERRSEARRQRRQCAEAPEIPVVPVVAAYSPSSSTGIPACATSCYVRGVEKARKQKNELFVLARLARSRRLLT